MNIMGRTDSHVRPFQQYTRLLAVPAAYGLAPLSAYQDSANPRKAPRMRGTPSGRVNGKAVQVRAGGNAQPLQGGFRARS